MLKLLIVKTSSLGDIVHNLPIVADIRTHQPDIEIDWLVEASFADIPRLHPAISHVIPVSFRRWRKSLFSRQTWQEISAFRRQIAKQHYDMVLDTQSLVKSAILTLFAHGKKHGFDKDSAREPLASFFYDIKHKISRAQQAVALNRALAAKAFNYEMPISAPHYGIKPIAPLSLTLPDAFVVGLHGTSRDSKLWPVDHWVALGKLLAEQQLQLVLPWASDAEFGRAQQIVAQLDDATVLPKLSIAELATLISKAKAAIGVDTGLSHLSAALSIPTIAIYTDTNPQLTGVTAGAYAPAVNIGGINQTPSPEAVFQAYSSLR
jgi:heptosyltransferase-1